MTNQTWSQDDENELLRRVALGHSLNQMATFFGTSYGTIATKISRLKKKSMVAAAATLPTPSSTQTSRPAAPISTRVPLSINYRPKYCQWPIGDPAMPNFHFCNASVAIEPIFKNKPYCYNHCQIAYKYVQKNKKLSTDKI